MRRGWWQPGRWGWTINATQSMRCKRRVAHRIVHDVAVRGPAIGLAVSEVGAEGVS